MKTFEGRLVAEGLKVGIIVARFNEFIGSKLLSGAIDGLVRHGMNEEDIEVAWVPEHLKSLWQLREWLRAKNMMRLSLSWQQSSKALHPNYDYVCAEVSKGVASVSLQFGLPVMFGVLTTDNIEQAIERAGTKAGNKGYDCALSAIEMANLFRQM